MMSKREDTEAIMATHGIAVGLGDTSTQFPLSSHFQTIAGEGSI